MMDFDTKTHLRPHGRRLAYCEFGDPDGYPLFYAHGSPGSRLEGHLFHTGAARAGFRFIALDRPGFGQSTYQPERTLLHYPEDVVSLADALGIDRFGVMGWSGGGAHTVVCAFALPDRIDFCISLAGYTNFGEMPDAAQHLRLQADRLAVRSAQAGTGLLRFFFFLFALNVLYLPELFYQSLLQALPPVDQEIITEPALKQVFLADQQEALRQGGRAVALDAALHYRDWGFRLEEIKKKVILFHGTADHNAPFAYSEHLSKHVPHCDLHILKDEGHMFPITHQDQIFAVARDELSL